MARYIDADTMIAALAKLENEYLYADGDTEKYGFVYGTLTGVRQAIIYAKAQPTADVAPKSEVANEVLDEAIRTVYSKIDMKIYNTIDGKPLSDHVAYGKQMAMYDVITLLAELKKKYTGEKK